MPATVSVPIVEVSGLVKTFGGLVAIDGLSLEIRAGEILGVVGPNGAGKTALVNVLTGFYRADGGSIRLGGRDITRLSRHRIARLGVARTFQNIRLFRRMSVLENVMVADKRHAAAPIASVLRFAAARRDLERAMAMLELMGLADHAERGAGELSYGDARRLEIARALAGAPRLLFLDEPAAGMNEEETEALIEDVRRIRTMVEAIVLIEHDTDLIRELSDRLVAMDFGRKMAEGTTDEVFADPTFIRAYLGLEPGDG
ncbi:MAG: ABC transporter ATP-binding protein [Rhodospirillaceae bacterium]